jgi:DNA polymerase-3 subunit alpha
MSLKSIIPPTQFTGLHAHTSFSTFDGLGYPKDHIDFITSEEQGMDSWALTDHGQGSGLAHARQYSEVLKKKGLNYRQLHGVEFYFVPSLKTWKDQYNTHREAVQAEKNAKKQEKLAKTSVFIDAEKEVESGGLVLENELETKGSLKGKPAWKRYYHLVVVAKNKQGLANLFTLVKKSYKDGFYRFPRIDFEMLKEHGDGLVVSTACVGGLASGIIYNEFQDLTFNQFHPDLLNDSVKYNTIMNRLENMTDYFVDCVGQENFFLELQFNQLTAQQMTNRMLLDLSRKTGVKLISTADSHFPSPDKWEARELYKKIGWFSNDPAKMILPKKEELKCLLYPKNAQQMWDGFVDNYNEYDFYKGYENDVKDSINRTHDIAWDMCEDVWIDTQAKLPVFGSTDKPAFNMLVELVKEKLLLEKPQKQQQYIERAKEELSDIKFLGHESYFIAMYKIFEKAREKTLFGPGRGSGSGSIVNYLLGITQIDPLPYGLLWSRFLGRHRVSWPDIDTDAGDRDVLIDAARELFGNDAVIPVSNFNTLKLKSLIKDISKFYGVPFHEVNKLSNGLQEEVMPHARDEDEEKSVFVLKHADCMKYSKKYNDFMTQYPDVERHVETLFMENRSIGRHAGGVIVATEQDIQTCMPLISVRGELQTPWTEGMNFRHLEDNGFLKFDFLGLTLLKDVENCIKRILIKEGNTAPSFLEIRDYFDKHLNCRYNKQDDKKVWKHTYEDGRLTAVFQFTADGARRFCLDAKPKDIETLGALTAIYRPGPLKANVHRKFVNAKKNAHKIKYDHPVIKEVLGPTFNFVIFQEQFMLLAQKLAGFSPGESDKLRKTLVKKSLDTLDGKASEREIAKEKFISGAKKLHGINEKITTELWETIEAFSVYGFNKSHAIAYAIDSYYSAWLHTYHEKEWLATVLQSENNNPKGLSKTIGEVKSYGYHFVDVDINYSGKEWEYSEEVNAFVPPLSSIKGVGKIAMDELTALRPFDNLKGFLYDDEGAWKWKKLNKTAIKSLCMVEGFNSFQELMDGTIANHKHLMEALTGEGNYERLRKGIFGLTKTQHKKALKESMSLNPLIDELIEIGRGVDDWSRMEKIENYASMTSTVRNDLVFPEEVMAQIKVYNVSSVFDIKEGTRKQAWFTILDKTKKLTKNNRIFWTLKVGDDENNIGWLRVWGDFKEDKEPDKYSLCIADVHNDSQWGRSTGSYKFKIIPI